MKNKVSIVLALLAITTLAACGGASGSETPSGVPESSAPNETETPVVADVQQLAFGKVLWDVYQRGILPDGGKVEHLSMESSEGNRFAINDVDGDGQDELLLRWENATMAGMVEIVFGYADGAVHKELLAFPDLTFYDNGMVEAGWSHNQGLAGGFWPYDVYSYEEESDTYQSFGAVDAWDRQRLAENFPTEIDVDEDGMVYYVLPADWNWPYAEKYLVDGAEYESWRNAYLDGAKELDIAFRPLTEENIAALGYPKPDVKIPQPVG